MTRLACLFTALLFIAPPALAEPTDISVRVIAKGGKFIGTSMGGARVVIRDAMSGEILVDGVTAGSTGDTARIMTDPLDRNAPRWTEGAGEFTARLDIDEPVKLLIVAEGPLAQRQAMAKASVEHWLVPGRPVTGGDGVLIELPGIAVDILAPAAHSASRAGASIRIEANAVLMCGCGLSPGGLWDTEDYVVRALIWRDGRKVGDIPLAYASETSRFAADYAPETAGVHRIIVYAHEPKSGNTGLDETTIRIQ